MTAKGGPVGVVPKHTWQLPNCSYCGDAADITVDELHGISCHLPEVLVVVWQHAGRVRSSFVLRMYAYGGSIAVDFARLICTCMYMHVRD